MARPKTYATDAERLAAWRMKRNPETKRNDETKPVEPETKRHAAFVPYKPQSVPLALFDGCGRGTVRTHIDGRRYVMVSRHVGPDVGELGVVTHADWLARLDQRCAHGHAGWSCHAC